MLIKYFRGAVYWADLPLNEHNNVQGGRRPVIIVSNNVGNVFSPNVLVVPCTTNAQKIGSQPTHVDLSITGGPSVALCENVMCIPKTLLKDFLGIIEDKTKEKLNKALLIALELDQEDGGGKLNTETSIVWSTEEPKKPKIIKDTPKKKTKMNPRLTKEQQLEYLEDFSKHGVQYVIKKYNVPDVHNAHQRKLYYKKQLTNQKK